jgi:hypothetical protein
MVYAPTTISAVLAAVGIDESGFGQAKAVGIGDDLIDLIRAPVRAPRLVLGVVELDWSQVDVEFDKVSYAGDIRVVRR